MFERFDDAARTAVTAAQGEARRLGHRIIGTEHLLLATVATHPPTASLLAGHGVTYGAIDDRVRAVLAASGSGERDALARVGIDLDRVRTAVEATFGPGALELAAAASRRRRWRLSLRRRRRPAATRPPGSGGHIPFSPRSKKVLELSLREALRLEHDRIGPDHLLLGILHDGEGLACLVLVELGVSLETLRADVERRLRRTA